MTKESNGVVTIRVSPLLLAYVAFVTLGLPGSMMGVAWPTLRAQLGLPLDALGLLLIASTCGYLISSFTIARLIGRFGIGALLIFSALASAVTSFGYTLAPSWAFFTALGALGGFGSGVMDAGLNTYLAAEYREGEMQWLHASFGIGATLSPLIMTASLALFASWRPAYVAVGALMMVMSVGFALTRSVWKRPRTNGLEATGAEVADRGMMEYRTPLRESLLRLVTWISILMFLLYTGAELTLGNWTYSLLTEGRGVNPRLAGLWAGGFWATFTIGRMLAGLYARRVRLDALMLGALTLAFAGALLFWWNPANRIGIGGVLVVGFAMAPVFPGLVSSTRQRVGERHAGNTIGIQISAAGLGAALLPSLAGLLAERISLEAIPVLLSISLLALIFLYAESTRTRRANAGRVTRSDRLSNK